MPERYYNYRQGIKYQIIGLISKSKAHEVYLVQNKEYGKTQIIHVLSNGNGQRYKVKLIDLEKIEKLKESAKKKRNMVIPWIYDDNAIDREDGFEKDYATER